MASTASRTDFLDRIRVVLTALVILHHAAIMFGAPGGWYLTIPIAGVVASFLAARLALRLPGAKAIL